MTASMAGAADSKRTRPAAVSATTADAAAAAHDTANAARYPYAAASGPAAAEASA